MSENDDGAAGMLMVRVASAVRGLLLREWVSTRYSYALLPHRQKEILTEDGYRELMSWLDLGQADETLRQEFRDWRNEVDSEHVCDVYDLALGYFSGAGVPHDLATQMALEEMVGECDPV